VAESVWKEIAMRDWIVISVLYVVVLFGFRALGGIRAAGEAFERWGRSSTTPRSLERSS
jgi:hypothetical protein